MTIKKTSYNERRADTTRDGVRRRIERDLHEKHARNAFRSKDLTALERYLHEEDAELIQEEDDDTDY